MFKFKNIYLDYYCWYDRKRNRVLLLKDMFSFAEMQVLQKEMVWKLKKEFLEVEESVNLSEYFFVSDENLHPVESYHWEDGKLIFNYTRYAIAAGIFGEIEVGFSRVDLNQILLPENPLRKQLGIP